jgi:cytochrome c-type biogenesis protein CcmH/NrfF
MHEAALLPIAHTGHWLWVLYVPPVLVVLFSIVRTTLVERRRNRKKEEGP